MEKTTLLIVEDHAIVREGIKGLLAANPKLDVIGEAADGVEALRLVQDLTPDVLIMDLSMPILGGLSATKQAKKKYPKLKIIILTIHVGEEFVYQAFKNGADGYVIKESAYDELLAAIDEVARGKKFFSPKLDINNQGALALKAN